MSRLGRLCIPLTSLALLAAACGGEESRDAGPFVRDGAVDSGVPADTGVTDTGVPADTGVTDTGVTDTGVTDTGLTDTGVTDTGVTDTGVGPTPTEQITAVRAAAPGAQSPALAVSGGVVTYVLPAVGADPGGLFVQADVAGPALFLAVETGALNPTLVVGDTVAFDVDETAVVDGQHRVIAVSNVQRLAQGADPAALAQDLSNATDVVSALGSYESEYIAISGTLTGAYRAAGAGHTRIQLASVGLPTESNLTFRVVDGLVETLGLLPGCDVTVGPSPLWRFASVAQVSAWDRADVTVLACASPLALVRAEALDATTVVLTFNRPVDAVSATPGRFTLSPAAAVSAVAVTDNTVTLTTAALAPLATYTVTVDAAVTDDLGNVMDPNADTATFVSPGVAAAPAAPGDVLITEIMQNPQVNTNGEWFELYNTTGSALNLMGCSFTDGAADNFTVTSNLYLLPNSYATIAKVADPGFAPTAVWNTFGLGNGADAVILSCPIVGVVDQVAYDGGPLYPDPFGASMALDLGAYDLTANDDGRRWCLGATAYNGDRGTPGAPNAACTANPPGTTRPTNSGDLVITEIFQNSVGSDDGKEWFELYNRTSTVTFNLYGCELADEGSNNAVVRGDLVVAPLSYVTVGTSTRGPGTHGFTPDYLVDAAQFVLGNGADVVLVRCYGSVIDRVAYDNGATFPDPEGASMSLDPASTSAQANDLGANWCVGTTAFSAIGFGTPGAANDVCPVAPPDAGVVDTGVVPDAGDLDGGVVQDGGVAQDGGTPTATGLIINEVDYDQPGTDTTEFVELYNAGTAPVDLTNVAVVTVNGSNNTEYGRYALSGSLAAGAYLVLGNAAVVVPGGVTFVTLPANGMQNGAPDAVALIDTASNTLLDALSYEGGMTSVTITGFAGPVSLVRGTAVTETDITDGSLSRLPNGAFSGDDDTDWTFTTTPTPGAANQ